MNRPACKIETCNRPNVAQQLCGMHYVRLRRNGDPLIKLRARGVMDAEITRPVRPHTGGPRKGKPAPGKIARQLKLAATLVAADGEVVSQDSLMKAIGAKDLTSLQNVMCTLRGRLKDWDLTVIVTARGQGYRAGKLDVIEEFLARFEE